MSPSPLLPPPQDQSGQDKEDDDTADDTKEDGLCGGGRGGGIFSACRGTDGLNGGRCWLDGLFDACRNPNGHEETVSSSPIPSPAPDFTPTFAPARRALAPAPAPAHVLGPAPDDRKGGGLWGGHGGDKGMQEEGEVAIEDLTAAFVEEGEGDSNNVRDGGTTLHSKRCCARIVFLFSEFAQQRSPADQHNDVSRM